MSWWPKRLLRWKEPTAFVREKETLETVGWRWWYQPAAALALALVWWGNALKAKMDRSGDLHALLPAPWQALALVAGGALVAWGWPWLFRVLPASVTLYEDRIARVHGNANWQRKLSQIATFAWEERADFRVLILRPRQGTRDVRLGVPRDIPSDTIQMALIRHGAMPLPDARVSAEGGAFAGRAVGV